jgi:hypothetical protein
VLTLPRSTAGAWASSCTCCKSKLFWTGSPGDTDVSGDRSKQIYRILKCFYFIFFFTLSNTTYVLWSSAQCTSTNFLTPTAHLSRCSLTIRTCILEHIITNICCRRYMRDNVMNFTVKLSQNADCCVLTSWDPK